MWGLSIEHWIIVIGVATLLFGRGLISGFLRDLGKGLKEGKKALNELTTTEDQDDA